MTAQNETKQLPRRTVRKFRDFAVLLPLTGVLLLLTPLLSLFTQSPSLYGMPSAFIYVFGVWGGLIVLAFALSRLVQRDSKR